MIKIIVFLCMDYCVFKFFLYWQLFYIPPCQCGNITVPQSGKAAEQDW